MGCECDNGPYDLSEVVPRVQRAVEGACADDWDLSPAAAYLVTADAASDILLYCGSVLGGGRLVVTGRDPTSNAPITFGTECQLDLDEMSVISAQAALTYFYQRFRNMKMSETIGDEASNWSWTKSPNLLIAQMKLLQDLRDKALEAIDNRQGGLDEYVSFLAARDVETARYIEPWVYGHPEGYGIGAGGLEGDFRFNSLANGGGDYLF